MHPILKSIFTYLTLIAASTLRADPVIHPSMVGVGLGVFGGVLSHESGHALAAKYYGWEVESFGFSLNEKGIGGSTSVRPKDEHITDHSRHEFLVVLSAGSLFQAIPVISAPLIARHSNNIYLNSSLEYLSLFGSADFFFYALKDQLMTWADDPQASSGD